MEQIAWRAIVAAAVLGIAIGVPSMILGARSQEALQSRWLDASEKAGTEADRCLELASGNSAAQDECWRAWTNSQSLNSWMMTATTDAGDAVVRGFLLSVVLPIFLFSAFFVFRWIGTGRWRKPRPS